MRNLDTSDQLASVVAAMEGKRMTYKELIPVEVDTRRAVGLG